MGKGTSIPASSATGFRPLGLGGGLDAGLDAGLVAGGIWAAAGDFLVDLLTGRGGWSSPCPDVEGCSISPAVSEVSLSFFFFFLDVEHSWARTFLLLH